MSLSTRIEKLEGMSSNDWEPEAITINVINRRKGGARIPINAYRLSVAGELTTITRETKESEIDFVSRATRIRDSHIVFPKNRHEVPAAPIMIQLVGDY